MKLPVIMKNSEKKSEDSSLRKRASVLMKNKPSGTYSKHSESDILKLIHELEVHQIELELQNEELIQAKETAEKLATEKYIELYDFAPSGYFTLTNDGKIIDLNLSGAKMLGKERSGIKNLSLVASVSDDTKPEFNQFLEKVFNSKVRETAEVTLIIKDELPLYVYLTGIVTENGEQCLVIAVDITYRKRAEINLKEKNNYIEKQNEEYFKINKELAFQCEENEKRTNELTIAKGKAEESDRLKSAFLANISHEIRTPMNGILGFTDLLKEPNLSQEKQIEFISIIEKSGTRLLNIINDVLTISKVDSGQMEVYVSDTNINEQIEYIYTFFKPQIEQKGMQISYKNALPVKGAIFKTDREKIYAILTNLVKNAVKFTETGSIELGYEKQDDYIRFFVKDTGVGIRPEQLKFVFDRFRQGSDLLNRNYEGTGLGLSISKAYVEILGGKIWAESEQGVGSTFYFTIPYQTQTVHKITDENLVLADDEGILANKLKILIAEDNEESEMLLSLAVKRFSNRILLAKTGLEAVEVCRDNPDLDLVLMDIKMPEMDGYEATRQIRQFNKDLVIVAQTAFALSGDRENAIAAGCTDYVSKPIRKDKLMEVVHKYF